MIELALDVLKDKSQAANVRLDALLLIVEQFQPEYVPLFEEILTDSEEDPDVRSAVALALGKISGERTLDILRSMAQDPDPEVRNYVIQALGMTQEVDAAPILINALKDANNTVFASASEALGRLGKKALPFLIDLLSEGAEDARCIAAWQLGEIGSPLSIPALITTIRCRPSVSIIALCIWALGEIGMGTDEVFEILTQAQKEPEPDVRLRAETALKKIVRHCN